MKTTSKLIAAILLILIGTIVIQSLKIDHQKRQLKSLQSNQETLLSENQAYTTLSGKNAIQIKTLELNINDLRRYRLNLMNTVSDLRIKLKRVESATTTITNTNIPIQTVVRDSFIYLPGKIDTLRCIDVKNRYFELSGCQSGKVWSGTVSTIDTIRQIAHRIPKKFLFIKYGTKAIKQEIISANPYTKIVYSEEIKVVK